MRLFIDDKAATIEDVCKLLKIRETDIPFSHKNWTFDRIGLKNKKDVQNQKTIMPKGHGIPCKINVILPSGDTVKVIYSENQTPVTRHGASMLLHKPLNLTIPGLELSIMQSEKVKFFFNYIHPYNKQSPLNLGKNNPNCIYEFRDTQKAAKDEDKKADLLLEAMVLLKNLGDKEIRQVAKGYKTFGVDDLSEAEVRKVLRAKLNENPGQFILDLENNEVALDGIIQDALDKGVITNRVLGTSKIYSIDKQEICSVQIGASEVAGIRAVVESNLEVYLPLVQNGIKSVAGNSVLKTQSANSLFSAFKGKVEHPDQLNTLEPEDRTFMTNANREAEEIEKLRKWAKTDINDASVHTGTKKAMVNNAEKILAQFRIDLAAGIYPEGTPEPVVVIQAAQTV